MNKSSLRIYLESQRDWVASVLCEMLRIPSESGHEEAMSQYLVHRLSGLDVISHQVPIPSDIHKNPNFSDPVPISDYTNRHNVIAIKHGLDSANGKTLVLNSHMDVVPPSTGQTDAYHPRTEPNGQIYARGACDAKGQIAVMLLLLKAACEFAPLRHSIVCHMVVEEEIGGNGTVALLQTKQSEKMDCLINLEPTDLAMQTSIRGAIWFELCFSGVAGHAGSALTPVSALDKAIAAVELLKAHHSALLARSKDYGLFAGKPNPLPLTVGQMEAGDYPSMTPASARIAGVMGILPNTTYQNEIQELKALFARPEHQWIADGMSMRFTYRHNAVELPVNHPFARAMASACRQCGLTGEADAMTASSDAIYYHELGIPSLAFGPGRISDAHSIHEVVAIDDILKAAEVIYTLLTYDLS